MRAAALKGTVMSAAALALFYLKIQMERRGLHHDCDERRGLRPAP